MGLSPADRAATEPPGRVPAWLRDADLEPAGFLANASNHTLLVRAGAVVDADEPEAGEPAVGERLAVYKPEAGERPLWDFPQGSLCRREVAAYEVSAFLGWDLVPATVLRDGPMGVGSVQEFVVHDPDEHYFTLVEDPARHERLAQFALFDLLVNNADRKASHVLRAADDRLWGIDHGLTFHAQPKLRTVIWELGGHPLASGWRADLARLVREGAPGTELHRRLGALLSGAELALLTERAQALSRLSQLPTLPSQRRPYPWPPL